MNYWLIIKVNMEHNGVPLVLRLGFLLFQPPPASTALDYESNPFLQTFMANVAWLLRSHRITNLENTDHL